MSGHDLRPDDLDRFAGLGISALRYPLLWETFEQSRDPASLWTWHDARLARLRDLEIVPILGLVHHGSGPSRTNLLAPDFVAGLADHAAAAARRYPWVRDWTPVNEPLTTARFAALYGHWYPHLRDESAFWLALMNQVDGIRAAMRRIRTFNSEARLIQTEDVGHTSATPECAHQAAFDNIRRWASWDMLVGTFIDTHPLFRRLTGMGFEGRLEDLAATPCPPDVLGVNHYLTSDRFLDHRLAIHPPGTHGSSPLGAYADVETVRVAQDAPGLEGALKACWQRYNLPMTLTEVHNGCTREEQMRWLKEAWDCATRLRAQGLEIEAVTAWSLLGAFDWDSLLTSPAGHYESGVFDVRGASPRETALAPMLRQLAEGVEPNHPVLSATGWWRHHRHVPQFVAGQAPCDSRPLLIAGATGTLGRAFAGACCLRGIDYVLTSRNQLHLGESASMVRLLDELDPWAVINCAGWVRVDAAEDHPEDCLAANFTGSVNLGEACRQRNIHYTCFSSDLVFDGRLERAYVESDATVPLSVYGWSKASADDAILTAGGRSLVIRTASFFSPYDEHNFAALVVGALRAHQPFRATQDCITSPTYVPDLVRTTLDLIIDDEIGLWHLVNDGALSWVQFALLIGKAMNLRTELIEARPAEAMGWAAKRPYHAPLTSERGLIMPDLASAVERFAEVLERKQSG